jgi:hypothetical protein
MRCMAVLMVSLLLVGGCAEQGSSGADAVELSAEETAVAHWLGRAYSEGSISEHDLFFAGFWMSDATFARDTGAWACLFEGVVAQLSEADDQGALDRFSALATADPDNPVEHRSEIERIFAALPDDTRLRVAEAVVAGDGRCGDVRLGMFGGGGPTPVCIWDRTTDDQRAKIIESSLGVIYPDQYEWSEDVRTIAEECHDEIAGAYGSGETIEWVERLEVDWQEYWEETQATTTVP